MGLCKLSLLDTKEKHAPFYLEIQYIFTCIKFSINCILLQQSSEYILNNVIYFE